MRLMLLVVPLLLALAVSAFAMEVKKDSFSRPITKTVTAGYALYLPDGYDPKAKKRWPLIIFLHGIGDRGDDLSKLTDSKWSPLAHAKQTQGFPFIVAAPQSPGDASRWTSDIPIACLDEVLHKYRVDADRVYLTGVSMGGAGAWRFAIDYPQRFAALAVVSGSGYPEEAEKVAHMPIRVYQGAIDKVVPIQKAQEMVDAVKAQGSKTVEMIIYPDMGHEAWEKAYADPALYDWFLSNKRKAQR
jgi:predicted peptidase